MRKVILNLAMTLDLFGAISNKKSDAGFAIEGLTKQKAWKCTSDSDHNMSATSTHGNNCPGAGVCE